MKEYIFTGGWKMNLSPDEGISFAKKLKTYMASIPDFNEDLKIIIFTDILSLYSFIKILETYQKRPGLNWNETSYFDALNHDFEYLEKCLSKFKIAAKRDLDIR